MRTDSAGLLALDLDGSQVGHGVDRDVHPDHHVHVGVLVAGAVEVHGDHCK